jgi:hypothetical protein
MTRGQIVTSYKALSVEDQRTFDGWLRANAVIGTLFAAAIIAMAFGGSRASLPGPTPAMATEAAAMSEPAEPLSAFELMRRVDPAQLPVQQIQDPL